MFQRTTGALIATLLAILLALSLAGPALAATPDNRDDFELGRFRDVSDFGDFSSPLTQALAVLALERASGTSASDEAVDLLLAQQCDDGGFAATFRAPTTDPEGIPCSPSVDTTAFVVQALDAVGGRDDEIKAAADWLVIQQDGEGSFGENANATGLAAVALTLDGRMDAANDAIAWLEGIQDECSSETPGAIPLGPGSDPGDRGDPVRATTQALQGLTLVSLSDAASNPTHPGVASGCANGGFGDPSDEASAFLISELDADDKIVGDFGPDAGLTIDALFGFAANEVAGDTVVGMRAWLETQAREYTQGESFASEGTIFAGATGKLALALVVAGADPRDSGGVDLIAQLDAIETDTLSEVVVNCPDEVVSPGDEISCEIVGLLPNEGVDVTVELNPTLFDDVVTADETGTATLGFTLPSEASDGETVTIVVDGLSAEGLAGLSLAVTEPEPEPVADDGDDADVIEDDTTEEVVEEEEDILPETGGTVVLLGLIGLAGLMAGTLTLRAGRRRRGNVIA